MDDTVKEVPSCQVKDADGNIWEIYPGTVVAYHRYTSMMSLANGYLDQFRKTADPLYVHKIAAFLDRIADVYYGLPVTTGASGYAPGKGEGGALTRAEWEAFPRPMRYGNVFAPTAENWTFPYGRRMPLSPGGVQVLGAAPPQWDLTWKTDYAMYSPFDLSGKRTRPLPDDIGHVRLRHQPARMARRWWAPGRNSLRSPCSRASIFWSRRGNSTGLMS